METSTDREEESGERKYPHYIAKPPLSIRFACMDGDSVGSWEEAFIVSIGRGGLLFTSGAQIFLQTSIALELSSAFPEGTGAAQEDGKKVMGKVTGRAQRNDNGYCYEIELLANPDDEEDDTVVSLISALICQGLAALAPEDYDVESFTA